MKNKVLKPVLPDAGLEAEYREELREWIELMQKSVIYWLQASYKKNEPEIAMDAVPAQELRKAIRRLARRWKKNFDEAAPLLAKWFATKAYKRSSSRLQKILRDAGFSVKFKMTKAQRDIFHATVAQNVSLIKSIPAQYFTQIEGMVMRSVQVGGDLETLTKQLHKTYNVTRKRAVLIARDQNLKATGALNRARQLELGIKEAIWMHSHAGKQPRPTHVAMSGKKFDVVKGMWDSHEKKMVHPGELINCFPGNTIVHSNNLTRLWRTSFHGPMIHINIGTDLLQGTPNHPILTNRGWVPIQIIDDSYKVVCMVPKCLDVIDDHKNRSKTTFSDLFEAASIVFGNSSRERACFDFHGDLAQGDVNEVVIDHELFFNWKFCLLQNLSDFEFAESNRIILSTGLGVENHILSSLGSGLFDVGSSFGRRHFLHTDRVGIGSVSLKSMLDQNTSDVTCGMSRSSENFCNSSAAKSLFVKLDDFIGHGFPIDAGITTNANSAQMLSDLCCRIPDSCGDVFEHDSLFYKFCRVRDKFVRDFSGHVFTMECLTGHYSVGSAFVQAKNCRCFARSIVPGFSI
jgi:hypothetical protein